MRIPQKAYIKTKKHSRTNKRGKGPIWYGKDTSLCAFTLETCSLEKVAIIRPHKVCPFTVEKASLCRTA